MSEDRRGNISPATFEIIPPNPIAGCLLVHGLTGSPPEMRPLGEYLGGRGYHCLAPLLPGHGTRLEDLHGVTRQQWLQVATESLLQLRATNTAVVAVGLSLGTLLVSLLAARHDDLAAVALLSPALAVNNRFLALAPILHPFVRSYAKEPSDVRATDAMEYLWHYDRWSTHALGELWHLQRLVARELPAVRVPALVVYSTADSALAPDAGQRVFDRWGCTDKELLTLHTSGHVVTVDIERDTVLARVARFFDAHVRPEERGPATAARS